MTYKKEWFNDEDLWNQYVSVIFDDAHWEEVPLVADRVTALARLDLYGEGAGKRGEGPRILDLCCGFGRVSLELARRGFLVTGVDITESYLDCARGDAASENLNIEFIHEDIRRYKKPGAFDTAVNLYISFGYFEDSADDLLAATNACDSLRPGGAFIIETLGKEIAVRDFVEAEWFERAGLTVLTAYAPVDSWTRLENRWILFRGDGTRIEKTFTQRLYAASELRALLLEAGFASVEIYGDWDESPYDERARSLIAVGRKRS
jgi:SAM-dependent methyltransferase